MLPLKKAVISWLLLTAYCIFSQINVGHATEARVVCYYTNWSVYRPGTAKFNPQNINPYLCTHLVYAFGGFTKDNTLKPFDKYQDIEQGGYAKFTGLKTYNKNLKTMLAIGGWNEGSSRFSSLVASSDRRQQFCRNIIKFLRQNHFDGLDLDWEYPAYRDGGKPRDRDNYAQFVQELREEFDRESSKTGRPRLLLTMAVPAGVEYIKKGYDIKKLNKFLDWFNLLSYDYHSAFEPSVNHHSPLYSLEEESEYNYDSDLNIDYSVKFYLNEGADRDKIVLGIPTYGRSYTLLNYEATEIGSPADGPGAQGDATREKGYLAYYEICQNIKDDEDWSVVQPDPKKLGPYAFRDDQWVGYDDEAIARIKGEYVVANGLGGIMFWSIDNDDFRGTCHGKPYPIIEAAKEAMLSGLGLGDNDVVAQTSTRKKPPRQRSRQGIAASDAQKSDESTKKPLSRGRSTTESTSEAFYNKRTTTPEPPTTPDPGADFKCEDEGFFPHPRDCKKYFWCLDSGPSNLGIVAHQFTCPSGLVFNKISDSCDYTRNVVCQTVKTSNTEKSETTESTITTTTTRRPRISLSTVKSNVFRKPSTTSTTTTEETVEDDDDEYEDGDEETFKQVLGDEGSEEDPKVIKELIELIKKLGGLDQLEKQLRLQENSSTSSLSEPSSSAAPALISQSLYKKVLNGAVRNYLPKDRFSFSKNNVESEEAASKNNITNRYSSVIRNSRLGSQSDNESFLKDKPKYVTISRPSKKEIQDTKDGQLRDSQNNNDGDDDDEDNEKYSDISVSQITTSHPQYVSIQRSRVSTTTIASDNNDAEEDVDGSVTTKRKYEFVNRGRPPTLQNEDQDDGVTFSTNRYKTIERTKFTSTTDKSISNAKNDQQTGKEENAAGDQKQTTVQQSNNVILTNTQDTTTRNYANIARKPTTSTTLATPTEQSLLTLTDLPTQNPFNTEFFDDKLLQETTTEFFPDNLSEISELTTSSFDLYNDNNQFEVTTLLGDLQSDDISTQNPEPIKSINRNSESSNNIDSTQSSLINKTAKHKLTITTTTINILDTQTISPTNEIITNKKNVQSVSNNPEFLGTVSSPRPFGFSERTRPTSRFFTKVLTTKATPTVSESNFTAENIRNNNVNVSSLTKVSPFTNVDTNSSSYLDSLLSFEFHQKNSKRKPVNGFNSHEHIRPLSQSALDSLSQSKEYEEIRPTTSHVRTTPSRRTTTTTESSSQNEDNTFPPVSTRIVPRRRYRPKIEDIYNSDSVDHTTQAIVRPLRPTIESDLSSLTAGDFSSKNYVPRTPSRRIWPSRGSTTTTVAPNDERIEQSNFNRVENRVNKQPIRRKSLQTSTIEPIKDDRSDSNDDDDDVKPLNRPTPIRKLFPTKSKYLDENSKLTTRHDDSDIASNTHFYDYESKTAKEDNEDVTTESHSSKSALGREINFNGNGKNRFDVNDEKKVHKNKTRISDSPIIFLNARTTRTTTPASTEDSENNLLSLSEIETKLINASSFIQPLSIGFSVDSKRNGSDSSNSNNNDSLDSTEQLNASRRTTERLRIKTTEPSVTEIESTKPTRTWRRPTFRTAIVNPKEESAENGLVLKLNNGSKDEIYELDKKVNKLRSRERNPFFRTITDGDVELTELSSVDSSINSEENSETFTTAQSFDEITTPFYDEDGTENTISQISTDKIPEQDTSNHLDGTTLEPESITKLYVNDKINDYDSTTQTSDESSEQGTQKNEAVNSNESTEKVSEIRNHAVRGKPTRNFEKETNEKNLSSEANTANPQQSFNRRRVNHRPLENNDNVLSSSESSVPIRRFKPRINDDTSNEELLPDSEQTIPIRRFKSKTNDDANNESEDQSNAKIGENSSQSSVPIRRFKPRINEDAVEVSTDSEQIIPIRRFKPKTNVGVDNDSENDSQSDSKIEELSSKSSVPIRRFKPRINEDAVEVSTDSEQIIPIRKFKLKTNDNGNNESEPDSQSDSNLKENSSQSSVPFRRFKPRINEDGVEVSTDSDQIIPIRRFKLKTNDNGNIDSETESQSDSKNEENSSQLSVPIRRFKPRINEDGVEVSTDSEQIIANRRFKLKTNANGNNDSETDSQLDSKIEENSSLSSVPIRRIKPRINKDGVEVSTDSEQLIPIRRFKPKTNVGVENDSETDGKLDEKIDENSAELSVPIRRFKPRINEDTSNGEVSTDPTLTVPIRRLKFKTNDELNKDTSDTQSDSENTSESSIPIRKFKPRIIENNSNDEVSADSEQTIPIRRFKPKGDLSNDDDTESKSKTGENSSESSVPIRRFKPRINQDSVEESTDSELISPIRRFKPKTKDEANVDTDTQVDGKISESSSESVIPIRRFKPRINEDTNSEDSNDNPSTEFKFNGRTKIRNFQPKEDGNDDVDNEDEILVNDGETYTEHPRNHIEFKRRPIVRTNYKNQIQSPNSDATAELTNDSDNSNDTPPRIIRKKPILRTTANVDTEESTDIPLVQNPPRIYLRKKLPKPTANSDTDSNNADEETTENVNGLDENKNIRNSYRSRIHLTSTDPAADKDEEHLGKRRKVIKGRRIITSTTSADNEVSTESNHVVPTRKVIRKYIKKLKPQNDQSDDYNNDSIDIELLPVRGTFGPDNTDKRKEVDESDLTALPKTSITPIKTYVSKYSSRFNQANGNDENEDSLIGTVKPFVPRDNINRFRNTFRNTNPQDDVSEEQNEFADEEHNQNNKFNFVKPSRRPSNIPYSLRDNNQDENDSQEFVAIRNPYRTQFNHKFNNDELDEENEDEDNVVNTQRPAHKVSFIKRPNSFKPYTNKQDTSKNENETTYQPKVARPHFTPTPTSITRKQNNPYANSKYTTSSDQISTTINPLLEALDRNALNSRNKKIFEKSSKNHFILTPITQNHNDSDVDTPLSNNITSENENSTDDYNTNTMSTNDLDDKYYSTLSQSMDDVTQVNLNSINFINELQDSTDRTDNDNDSVQLKTERLTTTSKPTTLHHIFAIDYDDKTDTTPVDKKQNVKEQSSELISEKLEKLAEVNRVVEIYSQQATHKRKSKANNENNNGENDIKSTSSNLIIEKLPTINKLGEVSRKTLIKVVDQNNKEISSELVYEGVLTTEKPVDDVDRQGKSRHLIKSDMIFSVETSTIALEALFQKERLSKQLNSSAVDQSSSYANSTGTVGPFILPLAPQLRPESNESSPFVISIANLDQVILSKVPKSAENNVDGAVASSGKVRQTYRPNFKRPSSTINDILSVNTSESTSSIYNNFNSNYNRRKRPTTTTSVPPATSTSITQSISGTRKYGRPTGDRRRYSTSSTQRSSSFATTELPTRTTNQLIRRRYHMVTSKRPNYELSKASPSIQARISTTERGSSDVDQKIEPSIQDSKFTNMRFNQIGEVFEDGIVEAITTISRAPLPVSISTTSRYSGSSNYFDRDNENQFETAMPITRRVGVITKPTRRSIPVRRTQSTVLTTSTTTIQPKRREFSHKRKPVPFERTQRLDFGDEISEKPFKSSLEYDYYDDSDLGVIGRYNSKSKVKVILHEAGIIECLDRGNFPHPLSCRKFISCAKMETGGVVGWAYTCPKGLSYDPVGGICNWSAGLGCRE